MTMIRPFAALRPKEELAASIAALPYDVFTRKEAMYEVANRPLSFLRVDRPETSFDDSVSTYDERVYKKADELLSEMKNKGQLVREDKPRYYVYELTFQGRVQSGIVGCVSVDDYVNGTIKRHENTREEKERDRTKHIDATSAHTGPVYLAHRRNNTISDIIRHTKEKNKPIYDFTSRDGVRHRVFVVKSDRDVDNITYAYTYVPEVYIADGHHRAASAVRVAEKRRKEHPDYTGKEEFNYFLAVLFDENELEICAYNRVVRDLNWLTPKKVLFAMNKYADPVRDDFFAIAPEKKGQFSMFLDDRWYLYEFKSELKSEDPVEGLDVSILQKNILEPIFGIGDPRKDKRIDFVGGIRGLEGLEQRCEDGFKAAFAMYPTSMEEFLAVADAGLLMPPKSTWFEPKLLSGFFIHEIER